MSTNTEIGRLAVQPDYGGFNPRFLGITLRYDSPENYNDAFRYHTDAPDDGAPDDLRSVILRSVGDHEARHYIDFLLSPYSNAVFRLRLMSLVNAAQAIATARQISGSVLPIPLTRWAALDDQQREATEAEWTTLLEAPACAVPIPHWTRADLSGDVPPGATPIAHLDDAEQFPLYLKAAARAYARIDQLTDGFVATRTLPYLRPVHVHEASALTVQLAAIHVGQGLAEALEFLTFLVESPLPQAKMWQKHLELATMLERLHSGDQNPLAAVRRILTITVWAMLGSHALDGARACPASRFLTLCAAVVEDQDDPEWSGDVDDPQSLQAMWQRWDRRLDYTPWEMAVAENLAGGRRAVETYRELLSSWDKSSTVPQLAATAVEFALHDQEKLAQAFLKDPTVLAVPERYVNSEPGLLPVPDVRWEFRGFTIREDPPTPAQAIRRKLANGETVIAGSVWPNDLHDPAAADRIKQKLELEDLMICCDLAFSHLAVPVDAVSAGRRALAELSGKHVLQLI